MSLRMDKIVGDGLAFLHRTQNSDGGIPATRAGAPSGCWTTAEAFEMAIGAMPFATIPHAMMAAMIGFLLKSRTDDNDCCWWPLLVGGTRGSTMATGHAVSALMLGREICFDPGLRKEIDEVIPKGFAWLERNANPDGGWGVEPAAGGDGLVSRIIATVYALRPYHIVCRRPANPETFRKGMEFCLSCKDLGTGGFGSQLGSGPDACSTARILTLILRSGYQDTSSPMVSRAVSFLQASRKGQSLWRLDTETYVSEGAPGQTVYNANTVYDSMIALLLAGNFDEHLVHGLRWLAEIQRDDGSWCLSDPKMSNASIVTWPTSEAIEVFTCAQRMLLQQRLPFVEGRMRLWRWLAFSFGILSVTLALYLFIPDAWTAMSEETRNLLFSGVFIALLVNIVAAFIYDRMKR